MSEIAKDLRIAAAVLNQNMIVAGEQGVVYLEAAKDDLRTAAEHVEFLEGINEAQGVELEKLRLALEIIAGKRPPYDNLMGNSDIAIQALEGSG